MLPPAPLTDPYVPISSIRFFTGELRSRRRSNERATIRDSSARKGVKVGVRSRPRSRFDVEIYHSTQSASHGPEPPLVSILPVQLSTAVSCTGLQGSKSSPVSRQRFSPRGAPLPSIGYAALRSMPNGFGAWVFAHCLQGGVRRSPQAQFGIV